jgi:hypothetical protein
MNENAFLEKLIVLAELPAPEKLTSIIEIASQKQLPEIARRAELSGLENEFLALASAVIASPEKRWIRLLHTFLASHGWKADLRGSPRLGMAHPGTPTWSASVGSVLFFVLWISRCRKGTAPTLFATPTPR